MYTPQKTIRNINADGTGEIYAILLTGYAKWFAITAHYAYIALRATYSLSKQVLAAIGKELRLTYETLILEADLRQWDKQYGTSLYEEYRTTRRNAAIAKKRQERNERMQVLGL